MSRLPGVEYDGGGAGPPVERRQDKAGRFGGGPKNDGTCGESAGDRSGGNAAL